MHRFATPMCCKASTIRAYRSWLSMTEQRLWLANPQSRLPSIWTRSPSLHCNRKPLCPSVAVIVQMHGRPTSCRCSRSLHGDTCGASFSSCSCGIQLKKHSFCTASGRIDGTEFGCLKSAWYPKFCRRTWPNLSPTAFEASINSACQNYDQTRSRFSRSASGRSRTRQRFGVELRRQTTTWRVMALERSSTAGFRPLGAAKCKFSVLLPPTRGKFADVAARLAAVLPRNDQEDGHMVRSSASRRRARTARPAAWRRAFSQGKS